MLAPADQRIVRHVLDDLLHRLAAVALGIFDLLADLTERPADPRHFDRRQYPLGMAGNTPGIEVIRAVARDATHARLTHATRSALNGGLMRMHVVALPRRVVRGMAVETARTQDHLARLLKQRRRACLFVLDFVELLDRC